MKADRDGANHFHVFLQLRRVINKHIRPCRRLADVPWAIDVAVLERSRRRRISGVVNILIWRLITRRRQTEQAIAGRRIRFSGNGQSVAVRHWLRPMTKRWIGGSSKMPLLTPLR